MTLVPTRRWAGRPLARLQGDVNDLIGRCFGDSELPSLVEGIYWPAMDVAEGDDSVTVKAELPGMNADDIHISVQGNTLSITGEKKEESEEKREGYYHSERRFGSFRRDLVLPADVDDDKIEAVYRDGVLTITMPKTEQAKAKAIEVKS